MTLTIDALKAQRRWVLWRLETRDGKTTKVPYQRNGRKASSDDPTTWASYADVEALASQYSGVGVVLGTVDGVSVWGVDLDACCDASTGEWTTEAREIVIALDSYAEFSPSGTGAHILGIGNGTLPGMGTDAKETGLKLPSPGCKAVEIYRKGRYLTFTGRHLRKTPSMLVERQSAVEELFRKVQAHKPKSHGLVLRVPVGEEARFAKLMAGDTSDYNEDHSAADFALCVLLAKKHACDAFAMDAEFCESGLYREKWDREDYKRRTITAAVLAVAKETPIFRGLDGDEPMGEDAPLEFLVDGATGDSEGWFPLREISVIGGPSGVGKTTWGLLTLERIRAGLPVWGRTTIPRDYRVVMGDRSKASVRRSVRAMGLTDETLKRVIRLTSQQAITDPADVLDSLAEQTPGVPVWFIEGLDMWLPDSNKMQVVAPALDRLQRVAQRRSLCVLASVGAPKFKGEEKDRYHGRDGLFGSAAWARKADTVVLLSLHEAKDPNSVRVCWVLPRDAKAERRFFTWKDGQFVECDEPTEDESEGQSSNHKILAVARQLFGLDESLTHTAALGCSRATYFRWLSWAKDHGLIHRSDKKWYLIPQSSGAELAG